MDFIEKFPSYRSINTLFVAKTSHLIKYRELKGACSEIHTKQINTMCGWDVEFFNVNPVGKRLRWSRGSVLAFSTQVRGFNPGRSRRIFRVKKSSACLPSEGK